MPRDTEAEARRRALARLLLLIGSWGFFLVVLSYARLPFVPDSFLHIGRDLGIALLVAAILGRLVDSALKQDLVRNAVSAAIGYLLPDSLKAELNWLYDQKFVTEQTYTVRLEHKPQGKVVIFHGHYARVIRNNSGEKACPRISGGTDEWFHPVAESEVTKCGFTRNGKFTPMSASNNDVGIGYRNKGLHGIEWVIFGIFRSSALDV